MTMDEYTKYFKARVKLCEALGLRVGAAEAASIVVSEEYVNKWKSYIDKYKVHFQAAIHFNGLRNVIQKGLKDEVKNNWSVQGAKNSPNTISETIKKADNFIVPKIGIKVGDSPGLDFMQQGKESIDKGGQGRCGPGRGQGGRGQSTTKQDGGGEYDISNKNPITTNGCYHCDNTYHILHFSHTSPRSREQSSISR